MSNPLKVLLIDSNFPINTRNSKIVESLVNSSFIVDIATWNREDFVIDNQSHKNYHIFTFKSELGNKVKKLFNSLRYYKFLKNVNESVLPDVIIASHFDMLIMSSIFMKKKQILVYENLDIPTHSNKIVLFFLRLFERVALQKANIIIHASRFYKELYTFFEKDQLILENRPNVNRSTMSTRKDKNEKLVVSFIGNIRYIEILKNLILATKEIDKIVIHIYGDGYQRKELLEFVENYNLLDKVFFFGKFLYDQIGEIYHNSDLVWAVYPNRDFNVKYAISNKFHESLEYETPGVFANNTCLGKLIVEKELGFVVDPYCVESIKDCLLSIASDCDNIINSKIITIKQYKSIDHSNWDLEFKAFKSKIFNGTV